MVGAWGVATVVPSGASGPREAAFPLEQEAVRAATASTARPAADFVQAGATFKTFLSPRAANPPQRL
ncbi:hypothetical protein GCM10010176_005280 [Nonomuraea spiralis]|nr:hypothetical protein GCM10010176_005280 [Nonomuraea spiralis]